MIQPVDFARTVAAVDVLWRDLNAPRRAYAGDDFLKFRSVS